MSVTRNRIQLATRELLGCTAALAAGLGFPAWAQAQEVTEIVVTARKVEENLKDVPLAITAFDSASIESHGISNLQDVANLTPGLSFFNAFGENLPVPVIRGVVPQDIFGENAAAVFVDGVYVAGRAGLNFPQVDIDRVEVLKGPQSALYGRNAFSGAINYVTKAPSDVFEARTEVEGGDAGKRRVMGQVSGPLLGEALTGRITAMYDDFDGSYENTLANGNDIGGHRFRSLQGKLRWRPLDDLDINLGLYSSNDRIDDPAAAGLPANCEDQVEQTTANATEGPLARLQNWCGKVPNLSSLPDALDPTQYPNMVTLPDSVTSDSMPKNPRATGEERHLTRGNLNVAWDTDIGTFSSLTGYTNTDEKSVSDFNRSTGEAIPLIYCIGVDTVGVAQCQPPYAWARAPMGFINRENGTVTEEWSQEIRFTSPQDQRLRYSVGAYYFKDDEIKKFGGIIATTQLPFSLQQIGVGPVAYPTALAIGDYIFGPGLTADGALDPLNRDASRDKDESWSIFASTDYDLTDAWTARAEIRLTQDHKNSNVYAYSRCDGSLAADDQFPFNFTPEDVARCGDDFYDLNVSGAIEEGSGSGSVRFQTVTGRASLSYKFESGWRAYGSIARGEKPGGLKLIKADVLIDNVKSSEIVRNAFDPEKITAYELGIKGYTADHRIGLDMSVFYNDWTDVVLRQLTDVSPSSGNLFVQPTGLNVNSGDIRIFGWEGTADVAFTDNLTGRLTISYTDSQLTNARQDTYALFPSFYTTNPSCAPSEIQTLVLPDGTPNKPAQDAKAGECRKLSGDVSGNTALRQPEWTSSASLSYEHQLRGDWDWFTGADANYLGKIFVGNDNESWLPARTNVNFRLGAKSARYSVQFWVRNLFNDKHPIAAFRDIYWTNTADIQGKTNPATIREASTFDDFPPLRLSVTYPTLRTLGIIGTVRFGGAEK